MKLVIQAHTLKKESLSQAITGHFDELGGTIGRSDTNTLTLPDPERHVSRLQAEVLFSGRTFSIRNVGSANPIELNGRVLRPGESAPLEPGDQLVIAGYAMRVVAEKSGAAAVAPTPRAGARTVADAPVDEPRTDRPPRPATPAAAAGPGMKKVNPARASDALAGLTTAAGLESGFDLGRHRGAKDGAALLHEFLNPSKVTSAGATASRLDLLGDPASPTAPAAFNPTPELAGAEAPPAVQAPPPPAAGRLPPTELAQASFATPLAPRVGSPGAQAGGAVAPSSGAAAVPIEAETLATPEALWRAFCEGAGLTMPLPQGLTPQTMRLVGQVLHHAVEGTLRLVAARAAAKQELQPQATSIQSKNNNPLKFSVDPQQALAQLLQPPMRGFMSGPEAVRDAMDDVLGHQMGTMTATRAALQGVFKRFEPAPLEARLTNKAVVDAVLPMNRRARLWELYFEHHQQVQDEAQDDFHELFGQAYAKAYKQQLDRLEASRHRSG